MSGVSGGTRPGSSVASHNMPARLTSFVGREREIAEVATRVRTERLVSLVGAPGVGKTRLGLQIVAGLLNDFPDGVWLIELAPLSDPDLVPHAVAAVLSVREQPGHAMTATLAGHLRGRRLLLLMDNCEHLVGACAALSDVLLQSCPGLHILATSREPIAIDGEVIHRVPSLSVPTREPSGGSATTGIDAYMNEPPEAVRLFVDRARAASPGFALSERTSPLAGQICARLDGIPLAIELAAARIRALSLAQIVARLDDRFSLLAGGSRTALPRQQTLRGAVDWSYELLSEHERIMLRRLAVFAGGFTLDAVYGVTGAEGRGASEAADRGPLVPGPSPLDALVSLVDKSLVQVEEDGTDERGERRYRLLETLRQYGHEKLIDHGELQSTRDRHRDYFLAFAEETQTHLSGPGQKAGIARLEREHDNLRAALAWCLDESDVGDRPPDGAALGLRLSAAIWQFWWLRGYLSEGRHWLARALAAPPTGASPADLAARPRALHGIANLSSYQGDYRAALAYMTDNLAFCRETGNDRGVVVALHRLGIYLVHLGEHERAVQLCQESVALGRQVGDRSTLALALHTSGIVLYMVGRYEQSVAITEEAIVLLRVLGNATVLAYALRSQAGAIGESGDPARAIQLAEEGLRISRDIGDERGIVQSYKDLARFALLAGDDRRAVELVRLCIPICERLGDGWFIANSLYVLAAAKRRQVTSLPADVPSRRAVLEESAQLFAAATALREQAGIAIFAEIQRYDHDLELLEAALGKTAFAKATHAGRAMSLKQAVDFALAVSAPVPPTDVTQRSAQQTQHLISAAAPPGSQPAASFAAPPGPQPAVDPWSPLTAREREVAELVAAGLTNRQIAARLIISGRTVQGHVASILTRLDFDTRAQIAAWAARRSSSPSPER